MDILVAGELLQKQETVALLGDALDRDTPSARRNDLRPSAIASAFSGNGRVIAAVHDGRIVGWAQLAHIDMLFAPSCVELCRYWGDDGYLATNLVDILIVDACLTANNIWWTARELHLFVCQEAIFPSLERLHAKPMSIGPNRWHATVNIDDALQAAAKDPVPQSDAPLLPRLLSTERQYRLVRY